MVVDNLFNKWNINKLPRQKGAQGNYGGAVYVGRDNQNVINNTGIQGHYLWGNYFDATQDINGDINTQGDVNFYGNLNYQGVYDPNDDLHGNLYIGRVEGTQGHFKYLNADILKATEAYIKNLTVTGSAHFFELIIDKIRSVGGAIMLTPADGFELWGFNVTGSGGRYVYLWWVANDGKNGKTNMWEVGDQALCMSFNDAKVGTSSNVSNKYWWAKVIGTKYPSNPSGANMNYCWKPNGDSRNPDKVEVLSVTKDQNDNIHHPDYEDAHPTYKRTDFELSERYCYINTNDHTDIISNEEYYNLSSSDKGNYSYCSLYQLTTPQNEVLYITEYQYNGASNDYIGTTPSIEIPAQGEPRYHLQDFAQSDCKLCFCIRLDLQNAGTENNVLSDPDSTFYVTENGNKAYVFQEGDNIIMLGNQVDVNRQNAIYLNAGGQGDSLDTELRPPFFAQYKGIGSQGTGPQGDRFNLEKRKFTWFSGGHLYGGYANNIQGNLKITTGQNVTEYVNDEVERGIQGIQGTYVTQTEFTVGMQGIQGTVRGVQTEMIYGFQGTQGSIAGVQSQANAGVQAAMAGIQGTNDNLQLNYFTKDETESQISQTARDINLRVTGVQTQGIQGVQGVQGELETYYSTTTQTEAMIGVQASEITLQVTRNVNGELSKTGINIEDGSITLDASKTAVTGELQLEDADSGIVLYDNNEPVIAIQNQSVNSNNNVNVGIFGQDVIESNTPADNYSYIITSRYFQITSNTNYILDRQIFTSMNGSNNTSINSVTVTVKIKQGNSDVATPIDNQTFSGGGNSYVNLYTTQSPTYSFNSGSYSGGSVYVQMNISVTYNNRYSGVMYGSMRGTIILPNSAITKIGSDGISITSGSSNFKINNGFMRRTIGSSIGDMGSIVNVKICTPTSENYQYTPDDGLVVFKGSWSGDSNPYYNLPSGTPSSEVGRIIYFKNMTGRTLDFYTPNEDNVIIDAWANATSEHHPLKHLTVGPHMCFFVCDGEYWYFGFCG